VIEFIQRVAQSRDGGARGAGLLQRADKDLQPGFSGESEQVTGEGVLVGRPLPQLATLLDGDENGSADTDGVVPHPGAIAAELEKWLALPAGSLQVDGDFLQRVEIPGSVIRVYLMRFTTIDPPFEQAKGVDAAFVPLTQTRGLPPVQMALLRTAYASIMEG